MAEGWLVSSWFYSSLNTLCF